MWLLLQFRHASAFSQKLSKGLQKDGTTHENHTQTTTVPLSTCKDDFTKRCGTVMQRYAVEAITNFIQVKQILGNIR